jgi:geranylgeranyl diphosphate synthase type I
VELIHNFSLIHDDLEDEDPERRHRPTVWRLWGVPQAVNAGSNMQALVNEAALRLLRRDVPAERTLGVVGTLTRAMLAMTEGQALDLGWQDRWDLGVDDYLRMAAGKTAALTEAAAWCGAAVATDTGVLDHFARFGHAFGMAFQARDDYLGIWGCREQTGKPVGADIQQGKRSLPIVHALEQAATRDQEAWRASELRGGLERREVERVLAALEAAGSQSFTERTAARYTSEALAHLDAIAARSSGSDLGVRDLRRIAAYALGRDE